jgi:hypothetical protein
MEKDEQTIVYKLPHDMRLALKEYLKGNLKIKIESNYISDYYTNGSHEIEVKLFLDGELINEDKIEIDI